MFVGVEILVQLSPDWSNMVGMTVGADADESLLVLVLLSLVMWW